QKAVGCQGDASDRHQYPDKRGRISEKEPAGLAAACSPPQHMGEHEGGEPRGGGQNRSDGRRPRVHGSSSLRNCRTRVNRSASEVPLRDRVRLSSARGMKSPWNMSPARWAYIPRMPRPPPYPPHTRARSPAPLGRSSASIRMRSEKPRSARLYNCSTPPKNAAEKRNKVRSRSSQRGTTTSDGGSTPRSSGVAIHRQTRSTAQMTYRMASRRARCSL